MSTLTIKPEEFDEEVWQTETDFTEKDYNTWVKETAIPTLQQIYDGYHGLADVYILGDVINMLTTMKIKVEK